MKVLLVATDLMARGRLDAVLGRLQADIIPVSNEGTIPQDVALVIADLDALGEDGIERLAPRVPSGTRVIGYFSHVNEALGLAGRAAGFEVYPRGRFWRDTAELVGAQPG